MAHVASIVRGLQGFLALTGPNRPLARSASRCRKSQGPHRVPLVYLFLALYMFESCQPFCALIGIREGGKNLLEVNVKMVHVIWEKDPAKKKFRVACQVRTKLDAGACIFCNSACQLFMKIYLHLAKLHLCALQDAMPQPTSLHQYLVESGHVPDLDNNIRERVNPMPWCLSFILLVL